MGDVFDQVAAQQNPNPAPQQKSAQGDVFDQVAANPNLAFASAPPVDQEAEASKDRMEALSGLTGMPVPGQNAAEFQRGKTAGMVSGLATVPAVVGATAAAPAIADTAQLGGEYLEYGGQRVLQFGEQQLEKFAEAYPHLSKLASHLGYPAGVVGAIELFRKLLK